MPQKPIIFEYTALSEFFLDLFNERKEKNPRYSRHAFARSLGISSSMLSFVINGSRSLSNAMITNLSEKLRLDLKEETYLRLLAELQSATSDEHRQKLAQKMKSYRARKVFAELSLDQFNSLSRWYLLALLEICDLAPVYSKDLKRISNELRVAPKQLKEVLQSLQTLGVIKKDANGGLVRVHGEVIVRASKKSAAVDDFHSQVMDKAKEITPTQLPENRVLASAFYSLRKENLPKIREELYAVLDKFHDANLAETNPDTVYACSMAFFKVFEREVSQ